MEASMVDEKGRRKETWEWGKNFWIFFGWVRRENMAFYEKEWFPFPIILFSKALATCPILSGTKRAHFFSWCDSYSATRREKNLTFWNAKILPRFACRFSGSIDFMDGSAIQLGLYNSTFDHTREKKVKKEICASFAVMFTMLLICNGVYAYPNFCVKMRIVNFLQKRFDLKFVFYFFGFNVEPHEWDVCIPCNHDV